MKRYIRTEDGRVFDIGKFMAETMDTEYYEDFEFAELENRNGETLIRWTAVGTKSNDYLEQRGVRCQFSASIISPFVKQSDDIGELCDCFVDYCEEEDSHLVSTEKPIRRYGYEIYAAIWTERGLIYVAKMDEKGEWELL